MIARRNSMPDPEKTEEFAEQFGTSTGGGQRPDDGVEDDDSGSSGGSLKEERRQRYIYVDDDQDAALKRTFDQFTLHAGEEYAQWRPEKNRHLYPLLIEIALNEVETFDHIDDYLDVLEDVVDEDYLPERA